MITQLFQIFNVTIANFTYNERSFTTRWSLSWLYSSRCRRFWWHRCCSWQTYRIRNISRLPRKRRDWYTRLLSWILLRRLWLLLLLRRLLFRWKFKMSVSSIQTKEAINTGSTIHTEKTTSLCLIMYYVCEHKIQQKINHIMYIRLPAKESIFFTTYCTYLQA